MSQSQAAVIRQLRTELAQANARPTEYDQLLGTLRFANAMRFTVPNVPTITIHLTPHPDCTGLWSVVRFGWYDPMTLEADGVWMPLADARMCDQYAWTLADALERVPVLLEEEARAHARWQRAHDQAARARGLAQVAEELLEPIREAVEVTTLQQAHQPPADPDPGISVPAARDVPGYGQCTARLAATVRDANLAALAETDADRELLTRLGRSIPATTTPVAEPDAETTTVIDPAQVRVLAGFGDTAAFPIVTDIPPMPDQPPGMAPDLADAMSAAS